jgi:outer membrane receptor protein involved in Fe transport
MKRTIRYLFFMLLLVGVADNKATAQAQVGEIAGRILDGSKEPVIGAVVRVEQGGIVKGGAQTDYDGRYSVKPLQAGRYDVIISYTGMKQIRVNDVIVSPSYTTTLDKTMDATTLDEVIVVSTYQPPLIEKGKPGPNGTLTSEQIKNLPTRNTMDFASLNTGVYQRASGGGVNIGGARGSGTLYIVDGIQVTGTRFINQAPDVIDQMQVITSGIPAKYGDASGGVINITTRGISSTYRGGITAEHSVEGYNTNLVAFNLSGPFARRTVDGIKKPIVGFFLAGDYRYNEDDNPSYIKNWVLKDDVLARLQQNPLVAVPNATGTPNFVPASEFITMDDMVQEKKKRNATNQRASLTGKLDYELTPGTNITAGGSFFYTNAYNYSRGLSLFAPEATSKTIGYTGRAYLRFTQSFKKPTAAPTAEGEEQKDETNTIQNAFYSVQADYQRDYNSVQDPNHKMDPFKYGYVGKFVEQYEPVYAASVDTASGGKTAIRLLGYMPTGVDYERAELNPLLANYTSAYYDLGGEAPLLLSNVQAAGAYLRNGDGPNATYSLWSNVGQPQTGFNKAQADQFSLGVDASFDYKMRKATHAIEFGLYYQQRSERFYGVNGAGLWQLMRLLTHRVVPFSELDYGNPTYVVGGKKYTKQDILSGAVMLSPYDTVIYDRVFNDSAAVVGGFDYNLRQKLGLNVRGRDYLQPDAYDPSMYSLDMFTADELLNNGASLVNYYGYDYTGNIVTGQVNFDDFWKQKDANGNYTRPIGAYRPNYLAGYISDNIRFKDILFTIGVRVERFDNNTKVLKDPYNLYAGRSAGQVEGRLNALNGGAHPDNIGDDYAVYVNDNASSSPSIIGYRNGDVWYDANGREISDPFILRNVSGGRDPQPYLVDPNGPRITDKDFEPSNSFEDYKPQVNAMPRISFSFPIAEEALFYAHYDVIIQRPKPGLNGTLAGAGAYATPADYFFMTQNPSGIIGNPNLKPEKAINYEVGFQQKLTSLSAITINGFYKERRDQIQVRPYVFAWPQTYYTFGNRDFSTTKGLGLKYDLRRVNHLAMTIAYTLQFADGTGSSTASGNSGGTGSVAAGGLLQYLVSAQLPNLLFTNALDYDSRHIISTSVDYRYGTAEGPVVAGKHVLENAGVNFLFQTRSGEPYTLLAQPQTLQGGVHNANVIIGQINGARLPWHYMLNMKVDKDFLLDFRKTREDGTRKGRPYNLNVYCYIQNLLNTKDVLGVYRYTGRPDDDGYLTSSLGEVAIQNQTDKQSFQDLYRVAMMTPGFYNLPRRITVGLQFNF